MKFDSQTTTPKLILFLYLSHLYKYKEIAQHMRRSKQILIIKSISYVQVFKGRNLQGNTMKEESELFLDEFKGLSCLLGSKMIHKPLDP